MSVDEFCSTQSGNITFPTLQDTKQHFDDVDLPYELIDVIYCDFIGVIVTVAVCEELFQTEGQLGNFIITASNSQMIQRLNMGTLINYH